MRYRCLRLTDVGSVIPIWRGTCHCLLSLHLYFKFFLSNAERPRLIIEPPAIVKVGPNGIIPAGKASGVDKIEWFINSYKIPIVSSLYEIFENNSLRMKFLREDLSGTYQIFYHNKAGFITRAIQVYVTQKSRGRFLLLLLRSIIISFLNRSAFGLVCVCFALEKPPPFV